MKKLIFCLLLACAMSTHAAKRVAWNRPYLPSARSGHQYSIRYTSTAMSTDDNSDWMKVGFNETGWELGTGPFGKSDYGVPSGTASIGTGVSISNGNSYYIRREFTLDSDLSGKTIYMACGHDDEGSIWIDGTKIISWGNNWNDKYVHKLTSEQTALLTAGPHVIAVWAKNNDGGYYWDCGLYAEEDVEFTAQGQSVGDASKLFDGDAYEDANKWKGSAVDENNVYITNYALFEASTAIYVNGLTLYTANDNASYEGRSPRTWKLWGSNTESAKTNASDTSWELIQEVYADIPDVNATPFRFPFNPSQSSYKYFKYEVTSLAGATFMQVGELVLDYSLEPKNPITHIANSGGKDDVEEIAEKLFDGTSKTKWYHNSKNNWVVFKTAKPIYASSYTFQTGNDADGRDPKTFKLYGAMGDAAPTTDGTTTGWTEIDSETDASGTIPTARRAFANFTIDKPGIYQYFMLKVEDTRTDNSFQLSEFIFDAVEVNTYTISSATELSDYARKVNAGEDRTIAKVTNDIVADANFRSIGTTTSRFGGQFDGQGHSIEISIDAGSEYQGLIGCAENGAQISNVIVKGSVKGPSRCGGVLGGSKDASGTITLLNCGNEASVTVDGQNAGGVVGCNSGGSAVYNLTNCYNAGAIKGGSESAGLSGWLGGGAIVTNCYNIGAVEGVDGTRTFARWGSGTYTNCYNTLSANEVEGRTDSYSMDKVASGELCYNLNGNANAGTNFYQDLAPNTADAHPIPFSTHKAVYRNQASPTAIFSNFDITLVDGKYQIFDAATLNNFSNKVNAGYVTLNAVMTANVNMTNESFTPIGNTSHYYKGSFDGGGHSVILNIDASTSCQGLFGCATDGASFSNLIVKGSVRGNGSTAALIGEAKGNHQYIYIRNVGLEANVTSTGEYNGAFVGNNWGGTIKLNVENSYNIGDVSGSKSCLMGGWSWWKGHTFTNVYNIGDISGNGDYKFVYGDDDQATFTNCYTTSTESKANIPGLTQQIDMAMVRSGELCLDLGEAFTQDLSDANYPTFGSKTVTAGQWFSNSDDVYYNYNNENGNITVYQLNMSDTNTKYEVPANVTAKNVSIERTIPEGQWIGLCLPFAYDIPSDWDVRELHHVNGSGESASMIFAAATTIEAGKPYIVKPSEGAGVTPITAIDREIATKANTVEEGDVNMIGNFAQTPISNGSYYINTSSQLKKLNAESGWANLKGFRAYFTVDVSIKALNFDFDDDATGIEAIDNGQLTIDNEIYNLAGQRINKVQKGVNIVNGKKILK